MKLLIDHLNNTTGWTISSPSIVALNTDMNYVAGFNIGSIRLFFDADDTTRVASKTFDSPIDVTDYDTLIINVWSRDKGKQDYYKAADFNYKIKINSTAEYYLKVYNGFSYSQIGIDSITSITKIEITALHDDDDYLIVSEMIVEQAELPLDILNGVIEHMEWLIEQDYGDGVSVGSVASATSGDTSITITGASFLERYAVVKIKDGSSEEIIQLGDNDGSIYHLIPYEGAAGTLVNSYTSATIYLQFPVYKNPNQIDIRLPGIAIWGIDTTPTVRDMSQEIETFSVNNDNFLLLDNGQSFEYPVLITCEAHHAELIDKMSRIIRKFVSRGYVWINARNHDLFYTDISSSLRPDGNIDIIYQVQYTANVEVKEHIYDRETAAKVQEFNLTVTPE